ncbi:MAG: HAMP domain-containing histidine kinase [Elusimicrobia bacterium]|nr:HAMP domain-containing histidine kinase [Elusimicrobiota bacterium]
MKLRYQYALWLSALIVAAVLGTSLCVDLAERRFLQHVATQRDHTTLNALAHITKDALLANDDLLLIDYAQLLKQNHPDMAYVAITSPEGVVLAHSDPQWVGQPAAAHRVPADVFTRQTTLSLGGQPAATVSFGIWQAVRQRDITQVATQARGWIWGIGFGILSVTLLAAYWLARSITSPIQRLEQAAQAIGEGHLDHRITLRRQDELGRLAQAFNGMAHRLGELNRLKDEFVQAVTHELRSPLGAISSFIHLMQAEAQRPTETLVTTWLGYLQRMQANTERLTRFINDVLDVAKLEEQKVLCRLVPCELTPVMTEMAELFQPQATERQLTLTVKETPHGVSALADPDHLRHILTNLLSNALKFTPSGGTITLGTEEASPSSESPEHSKDPEWIRVCVEDTGMGVPREAQGAIFDRFHQVPGSRAQVKGPKGTGLGLTIAKALVELQGGRIWVDSAPGQGSRFTFTLRSQAVSTCPSATPPNAVRPQESHVS